jgi:archaellum biogenesis protein FlaJ (TadC family)
MAKRKPIRILYSALSRRFYATQAWRTVKMDSHTEFIQVTGEKYDVTDQIARLIDQYGVTFTVRPLIEKEVQ